MSLPRSSPASLSLPPFLSRLFPIRDVVLAPTVDGRALRLEENSQRGTTDFCDAFIVGGARTCKTSLWWQAATSFVSEGKRVLCICRAVDRKPFLVRGMPLEDAFAARRILIVYVKTREQLVENLTNLVERTKPAGLPDAILLDDFESLSGLGDADVDSDLHLAKLFAILKHVLAYVRKTKAAAAAEAAVAVAATTSTTTSVQLDRNPNRGRESSNLSSSPPYQTPEVTLLLFSAPPQSRGVSLISVLHAAFDLVYEIKELKSDAGIVREDAVVGGGAVSEATTPSFFAMTPVPRGSQGQPPYRILFRLENGLLHFDKLQIKTV